MQRVVYFTQMSNVCANDTGDFTMTSDSPSQDERIPAEQAHDILSGENTLHADDTRSGVGRDVTLPPDVRRTRAQPSRQRTGAAPGPTTRKQYSSQRAVTTPPPQIPLQHPPQVGAARQRVQQRHQPLAPSQSGLYFPWWSLVIMVGIVGVIAFGLLIAFTEVSEPAAPADQLPRIQVVTSPPTLSQDFAASQNQAAAPAGGAWPTGIPQAQPTATVPLPTPASSPTLPPGDFAIGVRVQVVGVGETRLNIRSAPGLDAALLFLAEDGDVYQLVGGPQDVDGYEWWKLEDLNDSNRVGWAARNYLMIASQ